MAPTDGDSMRTAVRRFQAGRRLHESSSLRLQLVGRDGRRRLAETFVAAMEAGDSPRAAKAKLARAVPIALILFALQIAWDILWHWWTHRNEGGQG